MSKRFKNKKNRKNSELESINVEQRNALFLYNLNLPHNNESIPNSSIYSIEGEHEPCLELSETTESSLDSSNSVNRRRITSIHRNKTVKQVPVALKPCSFSKTLETRRKWMNPSGMTRSSLEQHANKIANCMARDTTLMSNTPESDQLRREALRDMPQCLTIKRLIKKKLNSNIHQRSKDKSVALYNLMKNRYNNKVSKAQNSVKSLAYSFELWYDSLKTIEGHFGSGVATYFKFFRWLFIMNSFIAFFVFVFIVIPQLLYKKQNVDLRNSSGLNIYDSDNTTSISPTHLILKGKSMHDGVPFRFLDIFTGEGYFTNTTLYYGYYVNDTVNNIQNHSYNLSYSYFFTMAGVYLASFIALSTSMARSYRKNFIETQGGLKNVFALKVFCGWDYSIANDEAAKLKSSSIFNELRELLSEVKTSKKKSLLHRFWTFIIQLIINVLILAILMGIGYLMWYLLEKHGTDIDNPSSGLAIVIAILINVIMVVFPPIFSFLVRYEDYKHPRAALYMTLIRVFFLKIIIVGVFLSFWLTHSTNQYCWETEIGQHIYRLILFNFLFSVLISAIIEASRFAIYKYYWKPIGIAEVDIARYTLQLMYNQTLFWVGLFFSPLLSVIVVILLWFTWYIRKTCVLKFCKPSSRSWRAAQTQTWFLVISFLSLLLVLITYGYIIANVPTSNYCGPFREYDFAYEMILKGILKLEQHNLFWKILMYFTKPGTVALILTGMCVIVYYLRAKAISEKDMVNILRDMLVLEAKDKEFLLKNISLVTEGQWQYNLEGRNEDTWNLLNSIDGSHTASTSQPPLTETSVDSD